MYESRNPPEMPPCETCKIEPIEENVDAIRIFFMIQDQYIMSEGGPVAINHMAIHEAMRLLRVKNRLKCFGKVCKLTHWWLEQIRDK